MKITVALQDISETLRVVAPCLGAGDQVAGYYLFQTFAEGDGYSVKVSAGSGQTFATAKVKGAFVEVAKESAFAVEGWRLDKCLKSLPNDGKALEFVFDDGDTKSPDAKTLEVKATMGSQRFDTLAPEKFPILNIPLSKCQVTATLPVSGFVSILNYTRNFIGKDEEKYPQYTVAECMPVAGGSQGNILNALRGTCAVQVQCPALKGATFRIYRQNVNPILSFLSSFSGDMLEILEDVPADGSGQAAGPTVMILRPVKKDGERPALFGENRYMHKFPAAADMQQADQCAWALPKAKALSVLPFLESGAPAGETRLRLARVDDATIRLSMLTTRETWVPVAIPSKLESSDPKADKIPPEGFLVKTDGFRDALKSMPEDEPLVGVNRKAKGGFMRFVREESPEGVSLKNGKMLAIQDGAQKEVEIPAENRTRYITVVAWAR